MKDPAKMSKTAKLVESALMIALAFVLSSIPFFKMPWGGTVTLFSTLPLIIMSLRHNTKWGVATASVYGFTQVLQGFDSVLAAKALPAMIGCIVLDYMLAYTAIGLTGFIARKFKNAKTGIAIGILSTGLIRFTCSFISGILIWGAYAPEGMSVWLYSFVYNANWSFVDVGIVFIATMLLLQVSALKLTEQHTVSSEKI